ncbi:MAG: tRNA-specific adenosine deaminase, partial [Candidatus Magasanikbacteria bacterium CG10_big_fil_rev_8_21_14_0_10_47_10]
LYNCSIYITLEPCPMCATLISYTRLKNLYYGARDLKFGAVESNVKIFESNLSLFKPNIYSG